MKKFFTSILLCALVAMAGCAKLDTIYQAATTSNVPSKTIFVAANAFNVVEASAQAYVAYCTPNPTPAGCNDVAIQTKIIPAITSGITARNTLVTFIQAHPGQLGDVGVYNAMVTATTTLSTLLATYDTRK